MYDNTLNRILKKVYSKQLYEKKKPNMRIPQEIQAGFSKLFIVQL